MRSAAFDNKSDTLELDLCGSAVERCPDLGQVYRVLLVYFFLAEWCIVMAVKHLGRWSILGTVRLDLCGYIKLPLRLHLGRRI